MKESLKAIVSTSCLIVLVFGLIVSFIEPAMVADYGEWDDRANREDLDGQIDFVVCGSCHCNYGIIPKIIDERLGCCSYNLSGPEINWYQRQYLVDRMIEKNEIDTIVFEIAYDNLVRDPKISWLGTLHFSPRMDSFADRVTNFVTGSKFDDFPNGLSHSVQTAVSYYKSVLLHDDLSKQRMDPVLKGFVPYESVDMTLSDEDIVSIYNSSSVASVFNKKTLSIVDEVMETCNENGIDVIFIVTPISTNKLWEVDNFDDFHDNLQGLADKYGYPLYDFNLLKDYTELFPASSAFHDEFHLSESGADTFNNRMCDIFELVESSQSVSEYFFDSYKEAKAYLEYMSSFKTQVSD